MDEAMILIQANGPLPLSATFNAPADGEVLFFLSGSVWSGAPNALVGLQLYLDGNSIGGASVFCNEASSHRAVVPIFIPVDLTFGQHTITVEAMTGSTMADVNDNIQVALLF